MDDTRYVEMLRSSVHRYDYLFRYCEDLSRNMSGRQAKIAECLFWYLCDDLIGLTLEFTLKDSNDVEAEALRKWQDMTD